MPTLLFYAAKALTTVAVTGSFFMLSNVVAPEVADNDHQESHIPRMDIQLADEFSPARAALEDEYFIANYEEEVIPEDIETIQLKAGEVHIRAYAKQISLPKISMNPRRLIKQQAKQAQLPAVDKVFEQELEEKQLKQDSLPEEKLIQAPHHWIEGTIELTGGLAITSSSDRIEIGWFIAGEKMRQGRVFLNEGRYEIKVDRLQGEIIAELIDGQGRLLGEDIIDLEELAREVRPDLVIRNVPVTLEPYEFGFHGQSVTVYDDKNNPDPLAKVSVKVGLHDMYFESSEEGKFREQHVNSNSTAVLSAVHKDTWDTLLLSDFTSEQNIRMFPEKYMTALFNTIELHNDDRKKGVIWGTISEAGQRAAGYRVQLVDSKNQAIYFALYIANPSLTETSYDGQFVFAGVDDGEYELEVIDPTGERIDSRLVAVRAGFVSQMDVELRKKRMIHLRAFDPLAVEPQKLYLFELGSGHTVQTQTEKIVKVPVNKGQDPVVLYSKVVGSEVETMMFASRTRKYQDVPILNQAWWARTQEALNIDLQSGVMVGFIDTEMPFEIFVENPEAGARVMYFDRKGWPVDRLQGEKAAGFVIYNMGEGLHTVIIQSQNGLVSTEAAYIDGSTVSLMYKSI